MVIVITPMSCHLRNEDGGSRLCVDTILYLDFGANVRKKVKMDEKVLESVLPHYEQFVKNRDTYGYNVASNAVYGIVAAGEYCHVNYTTCFGRLANLRGYEVTKKNPDAVLVQIQDKGLDIKKTRLFYEWLANFSPFRDALVIKDTSEVLKNKALIFDAHVPNRLMVGAAITARSPWEDFGGVTFTQDSLLLWNKLVEAGVHPDYAFIAAFGLRKGREGYTVGSSQGHSAFRYDHSMEAQFIHQNFVNNKPMDKVKTYHQTSSYETPSQYWRTPFAKGIPDFTTWLANAVKDIANGDKGKNVNPFAKTSVTPVATEDKIIAGFIEREGDFFKEIAA